jgi:exodeoxyribonuclease-5
MTQDWSPQQVAALKAVSEWFQDENSQQVFRLFGYAGTGKSTLALDIAKAVRKKVKGDGDEVSGAVLAAAFTGKAALVMQSKGMRGASTLHSLIYTLDEDTPGVPKFILNEESKLKDAKLLIIDECSMVGEELARDVLSFNVKVLVLGDPAQLPPVKDAGFFTERVKPDAMLTEVHRQAAGNPIIRLSMDIRAGVPLRHGDFGACKVVPWSRDALDPLAILAADQLLVGKNLTRERMNDRYRVLSNCRARNPTLGEKLVCLKNDRSKSLFNGGLWRVVKLRKANEAAINLVVEPDDAGETVRAVEVKIRSEFFIGEDAVRALTWEQLKETQQMTFGYALTVHKAQGSQWKNVILFNEAGVFGQDAQRWLYTGVTRAAEKLTVVQA